MCFMRDERAIARADRHLRTVLGDVGLAFFNFPSLSEVQRRAIPSIGEGANTLICAATAAGKTEAVIAPMVWRIRRQAVAQPWKGKCQRHHLCARPPPPGRWSLFSDESELEPA